MDLRYALGALRRNWTDRRWYDQVFNALVSRPIYRELVPNDGEYVVERDWDNLLVLDGCRFDLFAEAYRDGHRTALGGSLERITSRGSASTEFLDENFRGRDLRDTVYVTANPFVSQLPDDPFHVVDHVWRDAWDEDLETVRPDAMVDRAVDAHREYPDKRLVVHFMQPHYPFIGDVRLEDDRGYVGAIAKSVDGDAPEVRYVWDRLRDGEVDEEDVWRAYRANLELVLGEVERLVSAVPGKHVVTSDHGNAFGERVGPFPTRAYGHDDHLHIPALVTVPWLKLDADERRDVVCGDRRTGDRDVGNEALERRLEALGYR